MKKSEMPETPVSLDMPNSNKHPWIVPSVLSTAGIAGIVLVSVFAPAAVALSASMIIGGILGNYFIRRRRRGR